VPTKCLDLNGNWKLIDTDHDESRGAHLARPGRDVSDWMDTAVPGDIHPTLVAVGRLPDPFVGLNARECAWTMQRDWWHRREVKVPKSFKGDRIELVFDGLDTYAEVYVNGRKAGSTSNMFLQYRLDVTELIRQGQNNTIAVCVKATVPVIEKRDTSKYFACFYTPRIFARKAACHFSWDWAPPLPGLGIWRGVRLEAVREGNITDVSVRTRTSRM